MGCGKKVIAALRENPLFHITFPYILLLLPKPMIDIYIYLIFKKKGTKPCVLPVKKACWLQA